MKIKDISSLLNYVLCAACWTSWRAIRSLAPAAVIIAVIAAEAPSLGFLLAEQDSDSHGAPAAEVVVDDTDPPLLNAIRANSWEQIAGLTASKVDMAPQYAYLSGLASLAINQTDRAVTVLFRRSRQTDGRVPSDPDGLEWLAWTEQLHKRIGNHMTRYFKADALARCRRGAEAIAELERLVQDDLSPAAVRAMAYNALGVMYWCNRQPQHAGAARYRAVNAFLNAAAANPHLADPHVNLAIVHLYGGAQSWQAATEEFDRALAIEKNNGMAINGKGISLATKRESPETVLSYLRQSAATSNPILRENIARLEKPESGQNAIEESKKGVQFGSFGPAIGGSLAFKNDKFSLGGAYTVLYDGKNFARGKIEVSIATLFALNLPGDLVAIP